MNSNNGIEVIAQETKCDGWTDGQTQGKCLTMQYITVNITFAI